MRTNIDIAREAGRQQLGLVVGFCALVSLGAVFTQTERSLLPFGGAPSAFSAVPNADNTTTGVPGTFDIAALTPTLLRSIRHVIPHAASANRPFEPRYTGVGAPDPALPPVGADTIGDATPGLAANSAPGLTRFAGLPGGFVNPLPGFPGVLRDETTPGTGTPPTDGPPPTTGTPPTTGPTIGAVPEPATWGMMIAGFFAIGGAVRRHRRAIRAACLS